MRRFEVSELILTQADKGKSFRVHRDDVVVIYLAENPTTGYQWAIDEMNEEILELEDSDFALASDAGIGGGGEKRLRFKAKSPGTTRLELKLSREWEGDIPASQRYDVTIQVE